MKGAACPASLLSGRTVSSFITARIGGRTAHAGACIGLQHRVLQNGSCNYDSETLLLDMIKRPWFFGAYEQCFLRSRCLCVGRQLCLGANQRQAVGNEGLKNLTSAVLRTTSRARKAHDRNKSFQYGDNQHIMWWVEQMEQCKKPVTKELIKRLVYSNLLGLDENLRNGSLKEGSLNFELLEVKRKFPKELLLCRVGEFYETFGFDACILVEYAGLNPVGGIWNDTVPRAGCPVMNLRHTLDELTQAGFSACVYEEVKCPSQARQRKARFISGHAHPESPYVYGLAGGDIDLDFPEPVPVLGVSRSARGYCLVSVIEMMRTFSVEDGLTEEAVVAKLRARNCHRLFIHRSLRDDPSGMITWGEYGEGGLLWGECKARSWEWFGQHPVQELLSMVRELYDLDPQEEFREVIVPLKDRPKPIYVGTATQIGILQTSGVPSLIKAILPADCTGLCALYMRNLLLNPPPVNVAMSIQAACRLMLNVEFAIPDFTCVSAGKLVKLIIEREVSHVEFSRIRNMVEDVLVLHTNSHLADILDHLLEPTWLATGLQFNRQHLVDECYDLLASLDEVLAAKGDPNQDVSKFPYIPEDFFQSLESPWRGRVKQEFADNLYAEVDKTAKALSIAVENDFVPIVLWAKAADSPFGGSIKGDIYFSREHNAVWFKGRLFPSASEGDSPVAVQVKALEHAVDGKGRKVGEDWYTTPNVKEACNNYINAVEKANDRVIEVLRSLAEELKMRLNSIIFISVLGVIAKALFAHVSEASRRRWILPKLGQDCFSIERKLLDCQNPEENISTENAVQRSELVLVDLVPYWLDRSHHSVVPNNIYMDSLNLLTGPNGGGKSSILRTICAAALLGICGLMVPASAAVIPCFDSVMLQTMSADSPADGKSSFQMEMSELRAILVEATERSLVLIDELCRGTEVQKGTCIVASVIESLNASGCIGVLSTHLHGLLNRKFNTKGIKFKAMGTCIVNGQRVPNWKLVDGECIESLAFETARNEGIPQPVIQRAEELYLAWQKSYKKSKEDNRVENGVMTTDSSISCQENDAVLPPSIVPLRLTTGLNFGSFAALHSTTESMGKMAFPDLEKPSNKDSSLCSFRSASTDANFDARLQETSRECGISSLIEHAYEGSGKNSLQWKDAGHIFSSICRNKLLEIEQASPFIRNIQISCKSIGPQQRPPPSTTNHSCVYLMQRPDGKFYVGQTDNLAGRITAHRSTLQLKQSSFIYLLVASKSLASELETVLCNQLPLFGFDLVNKADKNHLHFGTGPLFVKDDVPF
eukprot:c23698_g1_i1 orf=55-3885(+)